MIIDKLCYQSKLRYVNAGVKLAYSITTLILCIISRSALISCIVIGVNTWLCVCRGGVLMRRFLRLMGIPLAFLLLSTIAILVNISRTPLDAYAIPIGSYFITGSHAGLHQGISLILTALASVSCLYFLSLNTPMTDILTQLRKLKLPALFIELMLLIYRFIFVLTDVASAITTSQNSRLGNRNFKTSCKSFGSLGSALFIRAMKKSDALYDSMEARCYDGTIHVLTENYPAKSSELLLLILYELLLILLMIWRIR
ncbi:cobalt ECF transporter T component CbiQ [Blautia liquoris]|uniref:Cobalt ECF transporter T component CbiQ n=1 Tax=Blautia liquoris TaxID=2779518 RepID=A0A7M2RIN6_9FIRM|nr:cobalt ECF transporter T component CbiQ [Blautia liquoris]QOV19988.1 cobalt ECF transporter T component CbiQ [Blautia liquoris]